MGVLILAVPEEKQDQNQEENKRPTATKTALAKAKALRLHITPPISDTGLIPSEPARLSFSTP